MASRIITLKSALLAVMAGGLLGTASISSMASPNIEATLKPVTVVASAQPSKDDRKATREARRVAKHKDGRAMMMPGIGPISSQVLQELELTTEQVALLDEAKQTQQTWRQEQREMMKKNAEARKAQLEEGKLDPRATIQAMDAMHTAQSSKRQEVQGKWLALWDALQPAQQEKIVQSLKDGKDGYHGRRLGKHGTHHHGQKSGAKAS